MWMNRHEIEQEVERRKAGTLRKAALILHALMTEVDEHSDGWPYWQAPAKAADKLMKLLQQTSATDKELRAALTPIKRFMTTRGTKAGMDERAIFAALEEQPAPTPSTSAPLRSDTKHTDGPWFYCYGAVWTTPDGPEDGGQCIVKRDGESRISPVQRDRNLQLCSAAPDLLKALEQMLEAYAPFARVTVQQFGEKALHSAVRAAQAAIAKGTR